MKSSKGKTPVGCRTKRMMATGHGGRKQREKDPVEVSRSEGLGHEIFVPGASHLVRLYWRTKSVESLCVACKTK